MYCKGSNQTILTQMCPKHVSGHMLSHRVMLPLWCKLPCREGSSFSMECLPYWWSVWVICVWIQRNTMPVCSRSYCTNTMALSWFQYVLYVHMMPCDWLLVLRQCSVGWRALQPEWLGRLVNAFTVDNHWRSCLDESQAVHPYWNFLSCFVCLYCVLVKSRVHLCDMQYIQMSYSVNCLLCLLL